MFRKQRGEEMGEVEDDSDCGVDNKRIVDSEGNFSESSQSWAVGNLLERK
jgi:hypothetical protein